MNKVKVIVSLLIITSIFIGIWNLDKKMSEPYENKIEEIVLAAYSSYGENNEYRDNISDDNYKRISNYIHCDEKNVSRETIEIEVGHVKWFKKSSEVEVYIKYMAYDKNNKEVDGCVGEDKYKIQIENGKIYIMDLGDVW